MKEALFMLFKGLSRKQIEQLFLEGESPTLTHAEQPIKTSSNVYLRKSTYEPLTLSR